MSNIPSLYITTLSQSLTLGGSETEIFVSSITLLDGTVIQTSDFTEWGRGILTIDPQSSSRAEFISFTGVDAGGIGFTGASRGLSMNSNTVIAANKKFHPVGTTVIISFGTHNIQDMVDKFADIGNTELNISGAWTFTTRPKSVVGGTGTEVATMTDVANAIIGASGTATNSVFGTVKLSVAAASAPNPIVVGDNDGRVPTQSENDAMVGNGGTPGSANRYVTETGFPTSFKSSASFFGNGSDGTATLNGSNTVAWATLGGSTYTMTADVMLVDLTINVGIILEKAGHILIGKGTLTNNGTIQNNGGNGGNGGDGANGSSGGIAGTAGTAAIGSTLKAGTAGVAGGVGAAFNGSSITGGTVGLSVTSIGSNGVGGGTGGGAANGSSGGTNTSETLQILSGLIYPLTISAGTTTLYNHAYPNASVNGQTLSVSAGGGSGGGGVQGTNSSAGGGGGGSGATGGIVVIIFQTILNSATGIIRANGGNGGTGGHGSSAGTACGGGGGAGGNGGNIIMVYSSLTDNGTIQANGGSFGAGGTGLGGGTTGGNGTVGTAGKIFKAVIS